MRQRTRGRSLGGIGCQCVCDLVGCRVPRLAVRLHRTFYVARWFGRRVALSLAPEAGATAADRILPGFGGIVTACCTHLLLCTSFVPSLPRPTGDSDRCCGTRFGHSIDPVYCRASTRPG